MQGERTGDTTTTSATTTDPGGASSSRGEPSSSRRSAEDWLLAGLESLSEEGVSGLRTERLAKRLGLTTGSFYWHFRGRSDFERRLLVHWERHLTRQLIEEMARDAGSPVERLHATFARVQREGLARYETPVRAWSLVEPRAARAVAKVDALRLDHVAALLLELGLAPDDVEMRARTLLFSAIAEPSCVVSDSDEDRARWLRMRIGLVTGSELPE